MNTSAETAKNTNHELKQQTYQAARRLNELLDKNRENGNPAYLELGTKDGRLSVGVTFYPRLESASETNPDQN